jgi:hypothetical protein
MTTSLDVPTQRQGEQGAVPTLGRLDLAAVELGAEPFDSDRDVRGARGPADSADSSDFGEEREEHA